MLKQIIDLAREFNSPLRVNMGDTEKVAGAFCLTLLIVFFALRDAILFIGKRVSADWFCADGERREDDKG